jgi:hypothetical protein
MECTICKVQIHYALYKPRPNLAATDLLSVIVFNPRLYILFNVKKLFRKESLNTFNEQEGTNTYNVKQDRISSCKEAAIKNAKCCCSVGATRPLACPSIISLVQ